MDSLQLERLLHKVEDMEHRHSQEISEMVQSQSQLQITKEQEILNLKQLSNRETGRLRAALKTKTDEIEKLRTYLEDLEQDLIKLK